MGIYDTKAGRTVTDRTTYDKSNALQAYIAEQNANGANLKGGILNRRSEGIFIFDGADYTPELDKWTRFNI